MARIPEITFFKAVYSLKDIPSTGLPEICMSGRSNVGKSSIINCLANQRNLAKISRTPGKTQSINYFIVDGTFYLVDLPGYGYAKISKSDKKKFSELVNTFLNERRELRGVIQLIDSRHGPVSGDYDMLRWLEMWGGSVLYVFTKSDKLSSNEKVKKMKMYEKEYGAENIVMFSALTGTGLETLWSWINRTLKIT
ncbi:MAG: YihA family ribosome biogenesis GTP-binding protein [Candidatus Latescibacteria bacterium]|jgi:GTP-binding protein|nr:YihA family ribosome biogenesis GTP-binding protein [Candidatus Latescibacterota bacterium]